PTARAAARASPYDGDRLPPPPRAATLTLHLPDPAVAAAWLDAEQANLLAAAAHAASRRSEHTIHQSATLHRHLRIRGHYTEAHTLHQYALTAAQATGDIADQVTALNNLGRVHYRQGRYGLAGDCLIRALEAARAAGHPPGDLAALNGLGWVYCVPGRFGLAGDYLAPAVEPAPA